MEDREQKRAERLRKKAMRSSLVQELQEELWEMPEEIKVGVIVCRDHSFTDV